MEKIHSLGWVWNGISGSAEADLPGFIYGYRLVFKRAREHDPSFPMDDPATFAEFVERLNRYQRDVTGCFEEHPKIFIDLDSATPEQLAQVGYTPYVR